MASKVVRRKAVPKRSALKQAVLKKPGLKHAAPRKVALQLLRTGVAGLDAVLGGGLPELSFNLIVGDPGAGKTTLAMAVMFANVTPARPGLYITLLGEPALKTLRYQQQFKFFEMDRVGSDVHFLNLSDDVLAGDLDAVFDRLTTELDQIRPGIVIIDSFRTLSPPEPTSEGRTASIEHFVQRLAHQLTTRRITSFLVAQYAQHELGNPVFTVADGVLWLFQAVDRNSVVRKFQVLKMRGMASMPGLHTVRISDRGLQIFPRMFERLRVKHRAEPERLSTGVPGLDQLMGGGIPAGNSVLLAGPTGSGKTTFATQFIADGLRKGERCVIAVFEEHPAEYLDRANRFGVDFSAAVRQDRLRVIYLRPLDLSVDEALEEIRESTRQIGATRVVIDSTSGLEMALAPTFREDYRESLYRLVSTLTGLGVTVFLTVEVTEGLGQLQITNDRVSFLSDIIILQRYIELEGRLGKVLAIVKIRGSSHSTDFLSYEITANGVLLRGLLKSYDGILSGAPVRQLRRPQPYPGLTEREGLVLESLVHFGNAAVPAIADSTGLSSTDLVPVLERLTELKYVTRNRASYSPVARPNST
ncbi:MAG: ATPase domain-containing protein [Gemmatimonadota bacterium]